MPVPTDVFSHEFVWFHIYLSIYLSIFRILLSILSDVASAEVLVFLFIRFQFIRSFFPGFHELTTISIIDLHIHKFSSLSKIQVLVFFF